MKIDVRSERAMVISDLHLGNPMSSARHRLSDFLALVSSERADLIINGDGIDIMQSSMRGIATDATPVIAGLHRLMDEGRHVYYVIGNHDAPMEHFIGSWLVTAVTPFLNVTSGSRRIRVEHGHLYDPWYQRMPGTYEQLCRAGRAVARFTPDLYEQLARAQGTVERLTGGPDEEGRRSGDTPFDAAARLLLSRGFDAVVFGHTHRALERRYPEGVYVNSGTWMRGSTYAEIHDGVVSLRTWRPHTSGMSAP